MHWILRCGDLTASLGEVKARWIFYRVHTASEIEGEGGRILGITHPSHFQRGLVRAFMSLRGATRDEDRVKLQLKSSDED